jgi:hypothetical protein
MNTYAAFLDVLTLLFLTLAIHFYLNGEYIVDDVTGRRGALHITIITWQTLLVAAAFCRFLRYIAAEVHKESD